MKNRILCIIACLLLTGCAASDTVPSSGSYGKFTRPGTDIDTMEDEKNFTDYTIDTDGLYPEESTEATMPAVTEPGNVPSSVEKKEGTVTVVLDPGHGGAYLGADYNGYLEKELSLKVGLLVRDYLQSHYSNVSVYMTREVDEELSLDQKEDLKLRVDYAVAVQADIFVSLHFNADGESHTSTGSLVCASKQENIREQSIKLGNSILYELSLLGLLNSGVIFRDSDQYYDDEGNPLDYYALCRHSAKAGIPGIIVEHAFMDNPEQVVYFADDSALELLAQADAKGIAGYFGLEEK